jgi:hypothetical protein
MWSGKERQRKCTEFAMDHEIAGQQKQRTAKLRPDGDPLHPAWRAFMHYCQDLSHGEIEKLSIQNGLPILAETTKKKVKFT